MSQFLYCITYFISSSAQHFVLYSVFLVFGQDTLWMVVLFPCTIWKTVPSPKRPVTSSMLWPIFTPFELQQSFLSFPSQILFICTSLKSFPVCSFPQSLVLIHLLSHRSAFTESNDNFTCSRQLWIPICRWLCPYWRWLKFEDLFMGVFTQKNKYYPAILDFPRSHYCSLSLCKFCCQIKVYESSNKVNWSIQQ